MNNNFQRFKNGDTIIKTHFKYYLDISICYTMFSILLIVEHVLTFGEIKGIGMVFLLKQFIFFLVGYIIMRSIYVSFRLSAKEILVILLFILALVIFTMIMIFETNIFSIDGYIFVTYNLHYYLIILGGLSGTLIFKLLKN